MIGRGIKLSTGFDLNSQSPLDNRTIFETIEERDSLPNINLYEGLECFIKNTKQKYVYRDGQWNPMEIWDDVIVTKDNINGVSTLSFYANGVLKKEVEIDSSSITADDIQFWDDVTVTKDTANNRNIISFYSKGILKKTIYIDCLVSNNSTDETIAELRSAINNLNSEIESLKSRVAYLEENGVGNPEVTSGETMVLEDETILVFEDETEMIFE